MAADGGGRQGVDGGQVGLVSSGRAWRRPAVSCTTSGKNGSAIPPSKQSSHKCLRSELSRLQQTMTNCSIKTLEIRVRDYCTSLNGSNRPRRCDTQTCFRASNHWALNGRIGQFSALLENLLPFWPYFSLNLCDKWPKLQRLGVCDA